MEYYMPAISLSLINLSIIFVTLIVVALGTLLFYRAAGNLSPMTISPISGAYYILLLLSVFGLTLFAVGVNHHTVRYMRHGDSKQIAWLTSLVLFIVFPIVIIGLNKLFKFDPNIHQGYLAKETITYPDSNAEFITVLIAAIVVIAAVIYTYGMIGIENSPIYNMIIGTPSEELSRLRTMAEMEFPGNQYIKNVFGIALTPFVSFIAFLYMRKTKETRWIVLFVLLFIFSNLIAFYNLQKAPIIVYWGTFLVLLMYYGDRIKPLHLMIVGAVAAVAILAMYTIIVDAPISSLLSINEGPLNRILLTTPSGYILHIEVFTYRVPFLHGASMPNPLNRMVFGQDGVMRSGRIIMETINFLGIRQGTTGVYNGLFLGEAYANFGKWGLFFSMLHIPAMFFLINFIFLKLEKNPITVALYTYFTVNLLMTINGGYADYVFSIIWILVALTALAMWLFMTILRKLKV